MFLGDKKRRLTLLLLVLTALLIGLAGCRRTADSQDTRPPGPSAEQLQQLEQLNQAADELYQASTTGRLVDAREVLLRLGDQVASMSFANVTTVEGVDVLTDAVVEAKREFNAVRIDPDKAVKAAARLKLAADTLTHPNQPMWLQYYKVLSEDTKLFEQSVASGATNEAQRRLGYLKDHYDTIRPAVWIGRTPQEAEKMDSLLAFFTRYVDAGNFQQEILKSGITQWKDALDSLFRKSGDRTAYLPAIQPDKPILWTVTVGSLIITVLMFSGWRMFESERNMVRRPRPRPMERE